MSDLVTRQFDLLPLVLHRTPPGLRMMLDQDGVPYEEAEQLSDVLSGTRRFVLFDSRRSPRIDARSARASGREFIDIAELRADFRRDPFASMIDQHGHRRRFDCGGAIVEERVARVDKARIRERVISQLRARVRARGGIWLRLARFPLPYRSAFNFRVDLDERVPADYWAFAQARRAIADCTTHFVSTAAYGDEPEVLRDLAHFDAQSHGHFHHVYRDRASNRANLRRAHDLLSSFGIVPTAFAAPGGRWNPGLDAELESLGYGYSSEFQLLFDDWPAYPWRDGRFSRVLQIPIHPVCEGIFFEAGIHDPALIADYFTRVIRSKCVAGQPAFLYGHPERRLGRFPSIVDGIAQAVARESLVWRTTLTEFAHWWTRRAAIRWTARRLERGRVEVLFASGAPSDRIAIEHDIGDSTITIPVRGAVMTIDEQSSGFRTKTLRFDAASTLAPPHTGARGWLREMLDWETVTPINELPTRTIRARIKKSLRRLRDGRAGAKE